MKDWINQRMWELFPRADEVENNAPANYMSERLLTLWSKIHREESTIGWEIVKI